MILSVLHIELLDGKAEEGAAAIHESLKNTRSADGCLKVDVAQQVADPHKFTIVERWQSLAHDTAYREWAAANSGQSVLGPLLVGPPTKFICELREDL
jgi:quinol monooxygenase YgiN